MRYFYRFTPIVVAAVITVIIRFTVFGDDCNLLVVGMTFVILLALIYGAVILFRMLIVRQEDGSTEIHKLQE